MGISLIIEKELPTPDLRKMTKIVKFTITFVFVTYIFVGIIGYATYSANINILSNTSISNGIILTAYGYTLSGERRPYSIAVLIVSFSNLLFDVNFQRAW